MKPHFQYSVDYNGRVCQLLFYLCVLTYKTNIKVQENEVFLNETTKDPLQIAFVNTEPPLTNSGLWLSSIVKIEII